MRRQFLKFSGRLIVQSDRHRIKYIFIRCNDIAEHYRWHIWKATGKYLNVPRNGGHVTIYNPKVHKHAKPHHKRALSMHGRKVHFNVETAYVIHGISHWGFENFIFKVFGDEINKIIKELGLKANFKGSRHLPHLVICNSKGEIAKNPHLLHWRTITESPNGVNG